jgi:hypothetical protein
MARKFGVPGGPELTSRVIRNFHAEEIGHGLSQDEGLEVLIEIIRSKCIECEEKNPTRIGWLFLKAVASEVDFFSDIWVFATLTHIVNGDPTSGHYVKYSTLAMTQGLVILCSLVLQFCVSYFLGQDLMSRIGSLLGLKPAIEAYRSAFGGANVTQKLSNSAMLLIVQLLEITTKSIPQLVIQFVALLNTDVTGTTVPIQRASILVTLVCIGVNIANADKNLDVDRHRRRLDPNIFGYVSVGRQKVHVAFMSIFFSSYASLSAYACTVAICNRAFIVYGTTIVGFVCLLAYVRVKMHNFRGYLQGTDNITFSVIAHIILSLSLLVAPFPTIRSPSMVTPVLYCAMVATVTAMNTVACVAMTPPLALQTHCIVTTALLIGCIGGGVVSIVLVPSHMKRSFFVHVTQRDYVRNFIWDEQVSCDDHKQRSISSREGIRATLITWCAYPYIPHELVTQHLNDNWDAWQESPPEFFDDEFVEMATAYRTMPRVVPTFF